MPNRHDDADPFKPGTMFGKPDREESYQKDWIDRHATRIKSWLGGRKMIFCPGNHDYHDPTPRLRAEGVDAVTLSQAEPLHMHDGVPFTGFPYCPMGVLPWNYALDANGMNLELEHLSEVIEARAAREIMLVAHCPPGGILDKGDLGDRFGNGSLTSWLQYKGHDIKAVLCGHVHPDNGVYVGDWLVISNAATTVHNLTFEFEDAD